MAIEMKTLTEGDLLHNRYRIEEVLGRGGFGITYKAVDTTIMLNVAVKQYISTEKRDIEHAINEARISAQFYELDGVSTARDFFIEDGYAYIIMSYVKGISLRKYVEKYGHFEGNEVLERFRGMLDSLAIIHEKGYIHRDITPDNILISSEGKLTLIDFGASRFTKEEAEGNHTVVFKRGFAPIEQCRTNGVQGTFTDIYAICATMYFMMTGIVPDDAVDRVLGDKLKSLDIVYGTGLTESSKRAIMDGLSVEPEERIQNVEELKALLYENDESKVLKPKEKLFLTEEMISYSKNDEQKRGAAKESRNKNTAAVYRSIEKFVGNIHKDVLEEPEDVSAVSKKSEGSKDISALSEKNEKSKVNKKRIVGIAGIIAAIAVGLFFVIFIRDGIGFSNASNHTALSVKESDQGESNTVDSNSDEIGETEDNKNSEKSKNNNSIIDYNGRNRENYLGSNSASEETVGEGESTEGKGDKDSGDNSTIAGDGGSNVEDSKETTGNSEVSSDNVKAAAGGNKETTGNNKKDKTKNSANSGNKDSSEDRSSSGKSNSKSNKSSSDNSNSNSNKPTSGNKTDKSGSSGNGSSESGNQTNDNAGDSSSIDADLDDLF